VCFVDFQKAFDCIGHEKLWWTLLDMGFPPHLVQLLSSLYRNQKAAVRLNGEISEWFRIYKGVRQGCVISPILFDIQLEIILRQALEHYNGGFRIGGRRLSNLRYADDTVLLASSPEELQELVNRVCTAGVEYNLRINVKKTQVMTTDGSVISITADGAPLTQVSEFTYLGATITSESSCVQVYRPDYRKHWASCQVYRRYGRAELLLCRQSYGC